MVHKPILSTITNIDTRQLAKSSNKAILWLAACGLQNKPEIISTKDGKLVNGEKSVVCKSELFRKWCTLYDMLASQNVFKAKYTVDKRIYSDVKQAAVDYQLAKRKLYESFKDSSLGYWVKKPFEQNYFEHMEPSKNSMVE
jgi:hypothetical protein